MKIKIYNRELTINELSSILNKFDDDMLFDLSNSLINNNNNNQIIDIITELYKLEESRERVLRIADILNIERDEFIIKKVVSKPIKKNLSSSISTGVPYKTNTSVRKLTDITELPSVDFDMPTSPNLPTLD